MNRWFWYLIFFGVYVEVVEVDVDEGVEITGVDPVEGLAATGWTWN